MTWFCKATGGTCPRLRRLQRGLRWNGPHPSTSFVECGKVGVHTHTHHRTSSPPQLISMTGSINAVPVLHEQSVLDHRWSLEGQWPAPDSKSTSLGASARNTCGICSATKTSVQKCQSKCRMTTCKSRARLTRVAVAWLLVDSPPISKSHVCRPQKEHGHVQNPVVWIRISTRYIDEIRDEGATVQVNPHAIVAPQDLCPVSNALFCPAYG